MRLFLFSVLFISIFNSFAQEQNEEIEKRASKFAVNFISKIGFAKLSESNQVALNGNINGGDILCSYQIAKQIKLSTGVGLIEFNGNRTINGNSNNLKNKYIHIPLVVSTNINLGANETESSRFSFPMSIGLYGNNLFKSELETQQDTFEEKNLGWNIGMTAHLGVLFNANKHWNFGILLENQMDLSKISHNNVEQKLDSVRSVSFLFGIKF